MDRLCYVAAPQGWESPKGLLMRTALHNGYGTVAAMCAALEVPYSDDGLDLLTEQSLLFSKLAAAAPEIAQPLSTNTYSVKIATEALWIIDEIILSRTQFSHNLHYCPECLRDELITVFQDLRDLPVCPLHRTQIVTQCPDCQIHEKWTSANLLFCRCGSDRRKTKNQYSALIQDNHLETYGPHTALPKLSHMIHVAQNCEDVWHSRKPNEENRSYFLMDDLRIHASRMISTQISKYPGFTRSMHLSPWLSSHPLLLALAEDSFKDQNIFSEKCITGSCCADVRLTRSQITYSLVDWSDRTKTHNFLRKNFGIHRHISKEYYYHCNIPICKLIRYANNHSLHLKDEKDVLEFNYLTTADAGRLLQCSSGTVLQLVELGYLQRLKKNKRSGSGNRALIKIRSIENFNNNFILVGPISNLLQTTPVKTVRLLNQLGISSDHNRPGPYIYEQHKIHAAWKKLETVLKTPSPLHPIVLPPTLSIQNIFKICSTYNASTDETPPFQSNPAHELETENNKCCYTTNQAAKFLNITSRLLYYRFVLTGLIVPVIINNTPHYSLAHIQEISHHLQHHMSIEQATRALKCGHSKTVHLISTFKLQPSCTLAYSNGDIQLFYKKDDIDYLTNHQQTKKTTRKTKRNHRPKKRPLYLSQTASNVTPIT